MKIGFMLPHYGNYLSGGYKVIYEYSNYLARKGHEVVLYHLVDRTLSNIPDIIPNSLKKLYGRIKVQMHPKWFNLDKSIRKIACFDLSEIEDGDIVIATEARTAKPVSYLDDSKGRKAYFIQDHENWDLTDKEVAETYSLGMCNIAISQWLSDIIYGCCKEKPYCIKDGIDESVFYRNHTINKIPHSISFHYRDASYKGCDTAYRVIEKLSEVYPDLVVKVVSSVTEPPAHQYCENFINIKPTEVAAIDNEVEVFLCTSREEGYGLPGLEAMACGAILVSTDYKGVREYAIDFDLDQRLGNSLLANVDDVDSLVKQIERVFEDKKLRKRIFSNSFMTTSELTVSKSAEKFEHVLIDIVSK